MQTSRDCFANFVADFRTTFVLVSRENFLVSQTSCKLVATFLNMFKNFMRIFSPKYFARLSRDVRASVANLSPRNFGEFTMRNFCDTRTNVARVSHDGPRQSCENLATIWRENKTKRHLYECRAALARMSCDCHTNLHSQESRETLSRMSRDCRAIYFQN